MLLTTGCCGAPWRGHRLRPRVAQRGRKRDHFEQYVTLAACALRNMSHRHRPRSGWHVGCNYNNQQRPTADRREGRKERAAGFEKKESTGLLRDRKGSPADTGYGYNNENSSCTQASDQRPRTSGVFFWRLPAWKHRQMSQHQRQQGLQERLNRNRFALFIPELLAEGQVGEPVHNRPVGQQKSVTVL
jgi:hypothetical protein